MRQFSRSGKLFKQLNGNYTHKMRLLLFNILCEKIKLAITIVIIILNFNYIFFKNNITEYLSDLI